MGRANALVALNRRSKFVGVRRHCWRLCILPGAARSLRVGLRVHPLPLVHYVEVGQFGEVRVAAVADEASRLARLEQPHLVDLLLHLGATVLKKSEVQR